MFAKAGPVTECCQIAVVKYKYFLYLMTISDAYGPTICDSSIDKYSEPQNLYSIVFT